MAKQVSTTKGEVIAIGDRNIPVIEHAGQRVVTLAMVDVVHQRPEGTAARNFSGNYSRFIKGEDFFELSGDEIRIQTQSEIFPPHTRKGILLTETGYLMLVKSFTDDLAWSVQRQLVNGYFRSKQTDVLTAKQVGGIAKAVIGRALEEQRQAIVADVVEMIRQNGLPSGRYTTSTEYEPALAVVEDAGIPKKGRPRGFVNRVSNALARWCEERGIAIRREAYGSNRKLYHVDAVAHWMDVEGKAMMRAYLDRLIGQSVMRFGRPMEAA